MFLQGNRLKKLEKNRGFDCGEDRRQEEMMEGKVSKVLEHFAGGKAFITVLTVFQMVFTPEEIISHSVWEGKQ